MDISKLDSGELKVHMGDIRVSPVIFRMKEQFSANIAKKNFLLN